MLVVAAFGSAYAAGWWRLRSKGYHRLARGWQLGLYLAGLLVVCLALLSPIDRWASWAFTMHMVQHLLLTMLAPPLLLLANPLPAILWALPTGARHRVGRLLTRRAVVRRGLWALTLLPVAWLVYVVTLWTWHLPALYQAALRYELVHNLEHLAFFGTGLLFWWGIVNPAPRLHGRAPPGFQILYLVAATGQNILLGAVIGVTERVLYPYYTTTPRLWGHEPLYDQALGAGLMWVSSHMYLVPILVLLARMLDAEERAIRQREAAGSLPRSGRP
ncbi:MAG: cytochrome c oxidase assembly protein [Deltaproteobacteria bacterium]|nr:cytochrome c oxidase assembly protein [Deltaproteobacteria bacterium]